MGKPGIVGRAFRGAISIILAGVLLFVISLALTVAMTYALTDVAQYIKTNPAKTSFMKLEEERAAKKGKKLRLLQKWVPLGRISPHLVQAVLIAEDDRFYEHSGLDLKALWEAMVTDLEEGKFKLGASTITQQLARNLYLSPSKNPLRKLREATIAVKLERTLGKKRILEIYLNVVQWDEDVYGAEEAALRYYGKRASELSAEEAARMAVVLPSPRRYDPLSDTKFINQRWRSIYAIMQKRGLAPSPEEPSGQPPSEPPEAKDEKK